jgi:ubiquinone/menaquinone biosynthesis C-methylase UbiE
MEIADLAKINPDSRVLDIATGIGEPAVTAAKKNLYWQWLWVHISHGHIFANPNYCKTKSYIASPAPV